MTGTELTNFMTKKNMPAVTDEQLSHALRDTVNDAGGVSQAGLNFLGFSGKQGAYSLGRDKEDVTNERLFLVEPAATIAGWTCWKESKPVGKHKWLSVDAARDPSIKVHEEDLEPHGPYRENSGDGWKEMMGIGLIELTDMTTSIEYSSTAVSAINGLKDLIQEASERLMNNEPAMPIIHLDKEQFTAQGATNWKPTFNVEVWVDRAAVEAFVNGDLTQDQLMDGAAPKKKRAKKPPVKRGARK